MFFIISESYSAIIKADSSIFSKQGGKIIAHLSTSSFVRDLGNIGNWVMIEFFCKVKTSDFLKLSDQNKSSLYNSKEEKIGNLLYYKPEGMEDTSGKFVQIYLFGYINHKDIVKESLVDERLKKILSGGNFTLSSFKKLFVDWAVDDSLQKFGTYKLKGITYYYIHGKDILGHQKIAVFAFKSNTLIGIGFKRDLGKNYRAVKKGNLYIYLLDQGKKIKGLVEEIKFVLQFEA
jgi:hypothetical protein